MVTRIAEGERFFRTHGYIPASHAFVVRGDVHREHPWVAFNLYSAFVKAKAIAQERLTEGIPSGLIFGREYLSKTREIFGADPFPYGIKENRPMLETLIEYSHEQGLTPQKNKIEDLFAPSTLDL